MVDRCAEIKSRRQWRNQFWQSLEEGTGKRCSECRTGVQIGSCVQRPATLQNELIDQFLDFNVPSTAQAHPMTTADREKGSVVNKTNTAYKIQDTKQLC